MKNKIKKIDFIYIGFYVEKYFVEYLLKLKLGGSNVLKEYILQNKNNDIR
jgi:hypothetical protein